MLPSLSRDVKRATLKLIDGLAGSRSDELKKLVADERWDDLVSFQVDPSTYACPESFFRDYASLAFLKKYEPLPTSFDRKAKAYDNFWAAEKKCYRTNQRLLPFVHNTFCCEDEPIYAFIKLVREKVIALIGERPPKNPQGFFGPGATFGDRGGLTTIFDKMQSRPSLTHDAWPFLVPWGSTLWCSAAAARGDTTVFERGSRFTTVPKDAKQDRGISIEPSINVFYQLAYGKAMRSALKKLTLNRVDLTTAQERHRQVARVASSTGSYATIDLSQASDTVSSALVKLVLPVSWYEVLNDLRSPTVLLQEDGKEKIVVLEKFSSMGNGYTFELETVIFMAICMAVAEKVGVTPLPGQNIHVFGDDIIVPTQLASEVIAALSYFGMETNKAKTFVEGPFRESCGGDFFLGVDVRPYYLKKEVDEPQHYMAMANGIRRMAFKDKRHDLRWHRLVDAWFCVLDSIPEHIRSCRGPQELGDICIHDDVALWNSRTRSSIRSIRVYKPVKHREVPLRVFDPDVQLAGLTYGATVTGRGGIMPRDSVIGHACGWVPFS